MPSYPKSKPVRSEPYRRLVAALPCIACGAVGASQCAHGPTMGLGIKASDLESFPLCHEGANGCHAAFDQYSMFDREERERVAAVWVMDTQAELIARSWDDHRVRDVLRKVGLVA